MTVSFLTPSFDAPDDVTRTPVEGSLAHRLADGSSTAALTFAGQGWRWWEDLAAVLERRTWLRPMAESWAATIAECASEHSLRDLAGAPDGFDPLSWIEPGAPSPSPGRLSALPQSLPGVLLTQLLAYREAWEDGLHGAVDAGSIVAVTGHSGGLLAAAAVAARPDGLDDLDTVAPVLRLSVLLGHVAGTCAHAVGPAQLELALRGDPHAATPMLAVTGVRVDRLAEMLERYAREGDGASTGGPSPRIVLHHGPTRAVLAGPPRALHAARRRISEELAAAPEASSVVWEPLAASAPFHSPLMGEVSAEVVRRAAGAKVALAPPVPGIALVNPAGPEVLAAEHDLVPELCAALLEREGHWARTAVQLASGGLGTAPADWLIDLGPSDGIAKLVGSASRGTGSRVLALATPEGRRDLVTAGAVPEAPAERYARFAPRLVALSDGTPRLENRFTNATGRSPVVLAGMTPTTVDAPIVAAAANAGFVAELAGGGQVSEDILTERLTELSELLVPGQEVVFNALHLDPYLWGMHLGRRRLVQEARRAGAPIAGVTVSAGIPQVDDAVALLDELGSLGMWCNSFKPGTVDQIRQVVQIARAAPEHTIFVHVEGGTAGGHHSWFDLEDLLLSGYHDLRGCPNVVLCAGGGIGTPARGAEYLTGRWSLRHTGIAMPVDAVLVGTAAMAAAEAAASPSVKSALRDARGRAPERTDPGFVAPGTVAGGVTSGRSGLDADIHFLDNSASRCAALLDQVAGDAAAVERRHDEIVEALGATAKPYFGDVTEMTYEQWLRRFVELSALGRHGRYDDGVWLDRSHRSRFLEMLQRCEARLHPRDAGRVPTRFAEPASVDDPDVAIDALLGAHPAAATVQLHPADPGFFLAVCRRPGKPVPFVPVIDAEVRRWYQSDSLWQAQHPAYDADQVLIIPGPAAVAGIEHTDEPIAELLARFEDHLVDELAEGGAPTPVSRRARRGPSAELTGPAAALLEARTVVLDGRTLPNPARSFGPIDDRHLTVSPDGRLLSCTIDVDHPGHAMEQVHVEAGPVGSADADVASMTITFPRIARYGDPRPTPAGGDAMESLTLAFRHSRHAGVDTLTMDAAARDQTLAELLDRVLIGGGMAAVPLGSSALIDVTHDERRRSAHARLVGAEGGTTLPDGALAQVWPAVFAVLGADELAGSLLELVHLEHQVSVLAEQHPIGAPSSHGDPLTVDARVVRVEDHRAGTRVDTVAELSGATGPLMRIRGAFLLRDRRGLAQEVSDRIGTPGTSAGADGPMVHDTPRRTLGRVQLTAPGSMETFAAVSGDHNPIHRSLAVARLAGLDAPIVHGAWTSALAQRAVIECAADGDQDRLADWHARFLSPVLPGEEVQVTVARTGVTGGRSVVEATAVVERPDGPVHVLTARAVVRAPRTAYLFPGQGIQRQGMGMDGYVRSAAARDVWDRADAHTREVLGFSILSIVRDNPTLISVTSPHGASEVHRHPAGVLHLTQFTQVAMAALAMAQVAELREQGLFDEHAVCAGHSVGEYNALASIGGVLPLEVVVEIVFRRGQSMHHLVPRDATGASDYRLGVIRPHQIGMDHAEVEALVSALREELGETLEIVNYNLRGKQYAVAGTLRSLDALGSALDERREPGSKDPFLYVPGIDVPFHSGVLRDGVAEFRSHLEAGLPDRIDPELLVGRYVPNLVPRPFTLDREFVQEVRDHVDSGHLGDVLRDWDRWIVDPGRLCRKLLIELLAWQFASPVRWIETQDLLFAPLGLGGLGVQRVIEVGLGSQPTIANLARGTLALGDRPTGDISVLNLESDMPLVFAMDEDPVPDVGVEPSEGSAEEPTAPAAEAAPAPSTSRTAASDSAPIEDLPLEPGDALVTLLALACKVRPDQLGGAETIDDLVDGVSSRRNQLLMDIGAEFSISGVDGAGELPLDQLAAELTSRAGRYTFPGPVLRDARDSALPAVLAPRRLKSRDVVARVIDHWGLGDGWADRVLSALAFEARDGESTRGGPIGRLHPLSITPDDAVDAAVERVAADAGVTLARPGSTAGGTVDAAAVAELESRIAGPTGLLAGVARDLLGRVAPSTDSVDPVDTSESDRLQLLDDEHGERRAAAVAPRFDARRHVQFSSWWATARHDVVALHHAGRRAGDGLRADLDAEAERLARFVVDPGVRASATWFEQQAVRRGDTAAAGRFERLLAGGRWTVPVRSTRPGLDERGRAVELDARAQRISDVLSGLRAGTAPWTGAFVDGLEALLGWGDVRPDLSDEVALVTGASPGSIAVEVVGQLLAGGATVVCTTTDDSPERLAFYRELYRTHGAPGAELHVVRANLASFADIDALVDWLLAPVVDRSTGVARTLKDPMSPTLVLPFAAGPVMGDLPDAGPASELGMRVLLWGVERLVGRLAGALARNGTAGRRTRVLLPLSPNHGGFGGDGAYGEAKAALEVFTEKWASEHERWGERVDLVAATIGWVRGTGLMDTNDAVAALVERDLGVRTWSPAEMGWLLTGLCLPRTCDAAGDGPLRVDLSGGLASIRGLHRALAPLIEELEEISDAAATPDDLDDEADRATIPALLSPVGLDTGHTEGIAPGAFTTPSRSLDDMVVIVGAGEVGPWGGSATRFDLEVDDELAPASVAELAWTCGLIRWDPTLDDGSWVDVDSDEPVAEGEIAERYRDEVRRRCGIRTFDADGPLDPEGVSLVVEVFVDSDVVVVAADEVDARAYAAADPENTHVRIGPDGDWQVVRRAGSSIRLPRRARLSRRVGAQVPAGFDPGRWGIPAEMAASVDRLSLWNLVATVEAFLDAGIEPEELMARVHPARVGNTQGSGMGGMSSIQTLYRDSVLGDDHSNDLLQEGLGNVIAAYVVQSYVGSYGPMVHPVAACATAAVSIEDAVDKIRAGKADVIVAGGWDDLGLEGVLGFAEMSATASTDDLDAAGLEPHQYSRSNDRRRAGFVEAQGGGTLLLARGSVAAELGLPVRGVVAYAGSFADGIHTSIPAPGLGALACALGGTRSPLATALAEHGLAPDDLSVVSKHDTSTAANDPNESDLHQRIADELGRSAGNPMLVVSQKTVTGHAKGGAAAWQAIGLLQVLESGVVPGNRNLECLDEEHRDHTHLAYGHRSVELGEPARAALLTSLGFGHVSAVVCLANAGVFHASLDAADPSSALDHRERAQRRRVFGRRRRQEGRYGGEPAYTRRVDRRLEGDDASGERREAEARLLTEPGVRLGPDGTYLTATVGGDGR